jgi:hypothetical protein
MLVDLTPLISLKGCRSKAGRCGIILNKNTIPFETKVLLSQAASHWHPCCHNPWNERKGDGYHCEAIGHDDPQE